MADNLIRFRAILEDKVSKQLGAIDSKFGKLGKSSGFKALTQGVGLGAGAAGFNLLAGAVSGATDFIGDAIAASSGYTETLSKNNVVFGKSAQSIEDWGQTTAKSLGIANATAIDAAAGFGTLFTGLDIGQKPAADMSKELVNLSGDLASFYDIADPKQVLQALQSGLNGESEPMRRFGVFLNENKVKAKAHELGLASLNGEVSEGAKVQARYALMLEETAIAHGDAARTSGELAGQQRESNALLIEQQIKLGKTWEPMALEFTKLQIQVVEGLGAMDQAVNSAAQSTRDWLFGIPPAGQVAADGFTPLTEMIGKVKDDSTLASGVTKAALDKITAATANIGRTAGYTKDKFGEMVDSLKSDADRLIAGIHDPIIARDNLLANGAEEAAARRVLASSTATNAEKADARATIHQIVADNDSLRYELLSTGQLNAKEQREWFLELQRRLKKSTGSANAYIQTLMDKITSMGLLTAGGITVTVNGGGGGKGKVKHGDGGWVGLNGPEVGILGDEGPEYIIPNHQLGKAGLGSGSGTTVVNFSYNPVYSTASIAEAQRFAVHILPALTREMRRGKVIPR